MNTHKREEFNSEKRDNRKKGASFMAEGMAMHRTAESMLPEHERICYDPYAIHFVNPEILKFAADHPQEAQSKVEEMEQLFPGLGNSIRARVRYFDDIITSCVSRGFKQLVILGAGYDTRPYRIKELSTRIQIFEVDHPDTQSIKKAKIKEIFGSLRDNVIYIPLNLETDELGEKLLANGYDQYLKTIFVMEGLSMYIPLDTVSQIFSFTSSHTDTGSMILFDYYPESVITGTNKDEISHNILSFTRLNGEPLKFGIPDDQEIQFLSRWGFTDIKIIRSEDYRNLYFQGNNSNRQVCSLLSFIEVMIP